MRARGKAITDSDEIALLFQSFLQVKNDVFRDYMDRKKEIHEEDDTISLTVDKFIILAQNKYNERTETNNNVWDTASKHVQYIITLKAEVTRMKGGLNLIPKILKKHNAGRNSDGGGGSDNSNGKQAKKRVASAAKNKGTAKILVIKQLPLKEGEKHTRVFGKKDHVGFSADKTYHWCPHHLMWCVQNPAEGTKGKGRDSKQKSFKKAKGHGKGSDHACAALVAMFQDMGDGDKDSES
jgi:hypothetical protein